MIHIDPIVDMLNFSKSSVPTSRSEAMPRRSLPALIENNVNCYFTRTSMSTSRTRTKRNLWFHAHSPNQVRCRNYLRRVIPFGIMLYELANLIPYHLIADLEDWLIAAAWPWVWWPVIHLVFELFQRNANITMTPELIVIASLGRKVKLNRNLPHEWKVIEHDNAEIERDEGRVGEFRFYGRSRTICVFYRGERHDILHVHSASLAAKFLRISENADAEMESELARGKGATLTSLDGFSKQAGGLRK